MAVFPFGAVVHKQRQIVALFRAAGATSSNRATTAATLGVQEGLAFRILLRHAVVREVGEQRVYLDESSWESHQKKRRRLAFIIPGLVLLCLALTAGIVFWATHRYFAHRATEVREYACLSTRPVCRITRRSSRPAPQAAPAAERQRR